MTTELEKRFFDTFGIEYRDYESSEAQLRYKCGLSYPIKKSCYEITDRHYLELICAYNNFQNDTASFFIPFDYKNIKNNILTFLVEEINEKYKNRYFCNDVDKLKHQVQAIFKGER